MTATINYPNDQYGALFDAHIHSQYDLHDGRMTPKDMVKWSMKWGFNWINAMSHDTLMGLNRIQKEAKMQDLPVIPSMEISTGYNHILAFGVHEWKNAKDCWDPEIVIEELRKQDCAIFLSHPCVNPWRGHWTPEIAKRLDVDGIEWINASSSVLNHVTWNRFKNYPKAKIAGSDGHHKSQIGYAYTQVDCNSTDPDDLVLALKKGRCIPRGRYTPLPKMILWAGYVTLKRKFFSPYTIDGYQISPNNYRMGWEPESNFIPEQWVEKLLQKAPLLDFE